MARIHVDDFNLMILRNFVVKMKMLDIECQMLMKMLRETQTNACIKQTDKS